MAEKSKATKKGNFVVSFCKGLNADLKKINWPTKDDVFKQSVAVLVISAVLCGFIRLIDVLAQYLIGTVSSIF